MTYGKAILITIVGLIVVAILGVKLGNDVLLLGMIVLIIISMWLIIKATLHTARIPKNRWKKKMLKKQMSERFETIYQYIENNYTYELELLRKALLKHIIIATLMMLISLVLGAIIWEKTKIEDLGIYVTILAAIYTAYTYTKYNKKYQNKYKKYVIENFIITMNNTLNYENIKNERLNRFYRDAQFENVSYDYFESGDYISGVIKGTPIEISDVILKRKIKSRSNVKSQETVYTCIFSYSQISKKIPQVIKIRNNSNPSKRESNRIKLDDEQFERFFDVFTDNRILAMEILTHDIMEEMVQFYNNSEIDFEIVMKDNRIYIRYEVGDIFEGKILKKSTNKKALWICYNTLNFAINLTTKINKILEEKEV